MEPPKKVQILHKTYDIEYHQEILDGDGVKEGILGCILFQAQVIKIHKSHPDEMEETLVHEVLHGICKVLCLDDKDSEETYVNMLSKGLLTVIKQNNWKLGDGLVTPKKRAKKGAKA